MKVLFIGGTGIISSACSALAVERGIDLYLLNRGQTSKRPLPEGAHVLVGDIRDPASVKAALGEMTFDAVDTIARGRVWTGEQALEIGLIDKLGGMETAIAVIKEKIGIPEVEDVELVDYPKMENPVQIFLKRLRETQTKSELPQEIQQLQQQFEELKRLEDERFFAWLPLFPVVE